MLNQQIIIYAHQYQAPAVVYAVQHDTGRTLTFVPGDFQIPAGATAQLWIKSPSGVLSFAAGTVSGQEITAALTEYNLAEAGNNLGQLQISADGDYIKGFYFILRVQEEVNGEELTPEEMTLLEQAIAEMQAEISDQLAAFEDEMDNLVPKTREINGHALDQDVTLTPGDIGAAAEDTEINGHPLTGDIDLKPGDIGAVPDTRTVNNYEMDEDITLHAVDIPFTPTPDIPETNVENAINAAVGLMSEAHEDLLYTNTGTTSAVGDYTLAEDISGYQYLDILFNFQGEVELRRIPVDDGRSFKMRFANLADSESSKFFGLAETNLSFSGTTMTIELNKYLAWPSGASEPELRTDGRPYVVTVYGIKYDAIGGPGGGVPIVIDDQLSPNSTNPVQNKVLFQAIRNGGLTDDIKSALLNCFANVAWINEDGQDYYDALQAALYNVPLVSISADFDPTETIYDTMTLDDLKQFLTVTANYGDGTEVVVNDYTLSGTLETGTSTITVTYNELTTTFTATVVGLVSITATYTQSGNVYDTDDLDVLVDGLIVTANYSDSTSETLSPSDYTLSGTLTAGTSTITVSYEGKTTTFSVTVKQLLPTGYTRLKYVTATGAQYVDTGVEQNDSVLAEYEVLVTSTPNTNGNHILSSANTFFPFLKGYTGHPRDLLGFSLKSSALAQADFTWDLDRKYHLKGFPNNKAYVDGADIVTIEPGTASATTHFVLFAYGGNTGSNTYRFHGNLYWAKMWDTNNAEIRYFIPCKNASNVVGLYDTINDVFYSSNTATALVAGEVWE